MSKRLFGRLRPLLVIAAVLGSTGCDLPRDPRGTLERVQGGELRVGVTEQPPWTERSSAEPKGIEAELVSGFADRFDAELTWVWGGEQALFERLGKHELDVVIGGLTDRSPWGTRVGLTRPYFDGELFGERQRHVLAVGPGENRFLRALETYLDEQRETVARRVRGAS